MVKVAISYRVLQAWRVPVFERLSDLDDVDLRVFYGEDFEGTKVKSFDGVVRFPTVKLKSKRFKIRTSNGYAYVSANIGLYSQLRSFSPDVIIVEGASNFFNNLICFAYAKMKGVPIIQWGLGEIDGRKRSMHRRALDLVFKWVERKSDAAIAYSSFGAEYYKKIGVPADRVFVAVNVVDTDSRYKQYSRYCELKGWALPSPVPEKFNIVFVGALSDNKKVENVLYALKKLEDLEVTFTIVGDGPLKGALEDLVAELGLDDTVTFAGHVNQDIGRYFYHASIFVLPGLGGLAVSDALVHGVPVLCGIGDGCEKDLIINGMNGYIVPGMGVDDIALKIRELYRDPEHLCHLRTTASAFHSGKYNISMYVKNIKEAIDYVRS